MDEDSLNEWFSTGEFDQLEDLFPKNMEVSPNFNYNFMKLRLFGIRGLFQEGLAFSDVLLQSSIDNEYTHLKLLILKGMFLLHLERFEEVEQIQSQVTYPIDEDYKLNIEETNILVLVFHLTGILRIEQGRFQEARDILFKSTNYAKLLDDHYRISLNYLYIGLSYMYPGELDQATFYYEKCQKILDNHNNLYVEARLENVKGLVYYSKKMFVDSLIHFQSSHRLWNKINNQLEVHKLLLNIGAVYREFGNTSRAEPTLLKALAFQEKNNFYIDQSYTLFELIQLYIQNNELDKTKEYYDKLKHITLVQNKDIIHIHFKISKALILANSPHVPDKIEAKQLLNQIQISSEYKEITLKAMKQNIVLLIEEYKAYRREDILLRAYEILDEIDNYYEESEYCLEGLILRAKILIIQGEFVEARRLLFLVSTKAEENEQGLLLLRSVVELNLLYEEFYRIREIYLKNQEISEDLQRAIGTPKQNISMDIKENNEFPIMLLALDSGGIIKLSYEFNTQIKINSNLLAALLSAINSFAEEAFGVEGSLDKISYIDFEILMQIYKGIQVCYIYKGNSDNVQTKLLRFIEFAEHKRIVDYIKDPSNIFEIDMDEEMQSDIQQIFYSF
ncbi:MAG: hypothetical protein INQ03_23540 [Candidatus Heimdallarchaeota archaeon]|nr:hypothetical protein [Candidatus Heimdallarchaeota archaeon]